MDHCGFRGQGSIGFRISGVRFSRGLHYRQRVLSKRNLHSSDSQWFRYGSCHMGFLFRVLDPTSLEDSELMVSGLKDRTLQFLGLF